MESVTFIEICFMNDFVDSHGLSMKQMSIIEFLLNHIFISTS